MKSRAVVIVGVAASVLLGLLGLFVGIMNTFTHWCGEDCGSDASRITFGLIQVVAALLLLAGAYLAARLKPKCQVGVDCSYCSIGPSVFLGVVYPRSRASVGGIGSLGYLA